MFASTLSSIAIFAPLALAQLPPCPINNLIDFVILHRTGTDPATPLQIYRHCKGDPIVGGISTFQRISPSTYGFSDVAVTTNNSIWAISLEPDVLKEGGLDIRNKQVFEYPQSGAIARKKGPIIADVTTRDGGFKALRTTGGVNPTLFAQTQNTGYVFSFNTALVPSWNRADNPATPVTTIGVGGTSQDRGVYSIIARKVHRLNADGTWYNTQITGDYVYPVDNSSVTSILVITKTKIINGFTLSVYDGANRFLHYMPLPTGKYWVSACYNNYGLSVVDNQGVGYRYVKRLPTVNATWLGVTVAIPGMVKFCVGSN